MKDSRQVGRRKEWGRVWADFKIEPVHQPRRLPAAPRRERRWLARLAKKPEMLLEYGYDNLRTLAVGQ